MKSIISIGNSMTIRLTRMKAFLLNASQIAIILMIINSCNTPDTGPGATTAQGTPVEVEAIHRGPVNQQIVLTATSGYLRKETIRSATTGFIESLEKTLGQEVKAGERIMVVRTKEANVIKNMTGDSALRFSGLVPIYSSFSGIISQLDHHQGDYVAEGDPVAAIAQPNTLVFFLKVPFAYHALLHIGSDCSLILPDGKSIKGIIEREMPSVDVASQAQDYIIRPVANERIPENLWVSVRIITKTYLNHFSINRACMLSNEIQTEFWVMKLLNDSTAVRINVQKGIETDSMVEILSPVFSENDRFVSAGNYGLSDTALVRITHAKE